ncbi:uncharacterized protein LOC111274175 [Durio zibethinus]|uniref:Uncharacterized protein LOC111274175 n=1 Tax=Durio zibethinus TaxID=66656 RepID=A0A6P5WET8_DURZI|nr:uncharacterized protein LOC111274175 [Durio zibethinus]
MRVSIRRIWEFWWGEEAVLKQGYLTVEQFVLSCGSWIFHGNSVKLRGVMKGSLRDCLRKVTWFYLHQSMLLIRLFTSVRVEGDGRLVPATDDELMEVEGLLENEKRETHIVVDTGQALGSTFNEVSSSGMPQLESSEGLSQSENTEADTEKLSARLEETVPTRAQLAE